MAFVDSDCLPPGDWLEPLLAHFDDPLVAAVAPRIVPGTARRVRCRRPLRGRAVLPGPRRARAARTTRIQCSRSCPAPSWSCGPTVVEGHELFDPRLRSGEDVDLEWRLVAAGWDVRYEPGTVVAHDGAATVRAFLGRRLFYGTSAGPLALRHGDAMAPVQASGWSAAVWLLGLLRTTGVGHGGTGHIHHRAGPAATAVSCGTRSRWPRGLQAVARPRAAVPALAGDDPGLVAASGSGTVFRRSRRLALLALLLPALRDRGEAPGRLDAARYVGLHVADDVAYGAGVWAGCFRARTAVPMLPRVAWRSRTWSSRGLQEQLGERGSSERTLTIAGKRRPPRIVPDSSGVTCSRTQPAAFSRGGGPATPRSGTPRRRSRRPRRRARRASRRRAVSKSRSRSSGSMRMTQLNVPSRPTRSSA